MDHAVYLILLFALIMLTAGYAIAELNHEAVHKIWAKLKRFIKVKQQ